MQIIQQAQQKLSQELEKDNDLFQNHQKVKELLNIHQDIPEDLFETAVDFQSLQTYGALKKNNKKVVKFLCMAQNSFNPEIYTQVSYGRNHYRINQYEVDDQVYTYNAVKEESQQQSQNFENILNERQVYYCIPVPYQNAKKPTQKEEEVEEFTLKYNGLEIKSKDNIDLFRHKLQKQGIYNGSVEMQGFPSIIKIQEDNEKNFPRLNEVLEIYGILEYNNEDNIQDFDINEIPEEEQLHYFDIYPNQLIPTIHVLKHNIIQSLKYEPIGNYNEFKETINLLKKLLSEICLNDELTAFYLLHAIIGGGYLKGESQKMILNIFNLDPKVTYQLKDQKIPQTDLINIFLKQILAYSTHLPLDNNLIEQLSFKPECVKEILLKYGFLQLPKIRDNFLVVDETILQAQQLKQNATKNLQLLNQFLEAQKIPIEYSEYYRTDVQIDCSGLILSEGRTFLYNNLQVFMEQQGELKEVSKELEAIINPISEGDHKLLGKIRNLIIQIRNDSKNTVLTDDINKVVQEFFIQFSKKVIEMDQKTREKKKIQVIDAQNLHSWIEMAKQQAYMSGDKELKDTVFKVIQENENLRYERNFTK